MLFSVPASCREDNDACALRRYDTMRYRMFRTEVLSSCTRPAGKASLNLANKRLLSGAQKAAFRSQTVQADSTLSSRVCLFSNFFFLDQP